MATVRINITHPKKIFEPLPGGGFVPPERSKFIFFLIANEVVFDVGVLAINALVKVSKSDLRNDEQSQRVALSRLNHELPSRLREQGYWDFFRATELSAPADLPEVDSPVRGSTEISIELNEGVVRHASEALAHLEKVGNRFAEAKKRLCEYATNNYPAGFAQSLPQARELLYFIERVLEAGADPGGYESHKARSALQNYQELARRKDVNNHNYRHAQNSLQSFVFGVTFPRAWARRPDA